MKKVLVTVLMFLLLVGSAAAGIGGEGWWESDYGGSYCSFPGSGLRITIPTGMTCLVLGDEYEPYHWEGRIEGAGCDLTIYAFEDPDAPSIFEDSRYEEPGTETAFLILQDDRDWYIARTDYGDGMVTWFAVTDGWNAQLQIQLSCDGSPGAEEWIRRIISSVTDA